MSETWNSSKQTSRHRRAMPAATAASGSSSCLSAGKLLVHVAHERVKVHARLAPDRDRREERVHQKALAATDAAPQVDAARHVGRQEQLLQRRLPRGAKRFELARELLEAIERCRLRVIERRAARREDRVEPRDEGVVRAP